MHDARTGHPVSERVSDERLARLIGECAAERKPWCSLEEWERIVTEPLPKGATETLHSMHDRPRLMLDLRDARAALAAMTAERDALAFVVQGTIGWWSEVVKRRLHSGPLDFDVEICKQQMDALQLALDKATGPSLMDEVDALRAERDALRRTLFAAQQAVLTEGMACNALVGVLKEARQQVFASTNMCSSENPHTCCQPLNAAEEMSCTTGNVLRRIDAALAVHAQRGGGEAAASAVQVHPAPDPDGEAGEGPAATPPPPSRDELLALVEEAAQAGYDVARRAINLELRGETAARVLDAWERGRTQEVKP